MPSIFRSVAVVALTTAPVMAHATTDQMYSGSDCQPVFGPEKAFTNTLENGLTNVQGNALWVTCPIVRDYGLNANALRAAVFIRQPATVSTTCFLHKFDVAGQHEAVAETQFGDGTVFLRIEADAGSADTASITCALGPGARLQSYNYYDT